MVHSYMSYARVTTMIRGSLVTLIYQRTLQLKEGILKESAAVSLSMLPGYNLKVDRTC